MNLLPFKDQQRIVRDYHTRLFGVVVVAIAVLAVIGLVLLAPAYLIAYQKESLAENQLAQATRDGAGSGVGAEDPKEVVRRIDAKVLVLKPATENTSYPSEKIEAFLAHQTPGITISSLFLDVAPEGGRMTISGNADKRTSLAQFEKTLKEDPLFANVEIPRASYLKPADIDFSITVALADSGKNTEAEAPTNGAANP